MTDRTVKLTLILICIGLWLNLFDSWLRPLPAAAQSSSADIIQYKIGLIDLAIDRMRADVSKIERGVCTNRKICEGPAR
jgi:hypothetical protein